MCGSLGRKVLWVSNVDSTGFGSLTVCAGDLCGRLGVDESPSRCKSVPSLNLSNQSSLGSLSKVWPEDANPKVSNFN